MIIITHRLRRVAMLTAFGALALSGGTLPAQAEVRESVAHGFSIEHERTVAATPDQLFAALSRPDLWWDSGHSWSGDAANLSFDPRAGGCWCERLADGGSVEHGRVVMFNPRNRAIVMQSLLGPMLEIGESGLLIWRVEPVEGENRRARLVWLYRVTLHPTRTPGADADLAAAVDGVLGEQIDRIAAFAARQPAVTPRR